MLLALVSVGCACSAASGRACILSFILCLCCVCFAGEFACVVCALCCVYLCLHVRTHGSFSCVLRLVSYERVYYMCMWISSVCVHASLSRVEVC